MTDILYSECKKQIDNCTKARQQLSQIKKDVEDAAKHVDQVASWWVAVETSLCKISEDVRSIQEDKRNKLRLKQMKNEWDVIRGKYMEYKSEVRS